MELFGAVDCYHVLRHFAFTTFEMPHSFFFTFFVAFVVGCFCVTSLNKDGKGGGGEVMSSITSEDVDHCWQLEDLPRIQYKEH